jgi:type IV pilus assembly protein PilV
MSRRTARRGYTIIELMMSLTVLAIGTSGVIAMQRVTLESNAYAKNLAVATGIASAWADALAADASLWNRANDLGDTAWLDQVGTVGFFRPAYDTDRQLGAGFSPLGAPLVDADSAKAVYCTDLRLTQVVDPNVQPGAGLIRAEIRVFWRRPGAVTATAAPADICANGTNPPSNVDANEGAYHVVYVSTLLAQTGTGS